MTMTAKILVVDDDPDMLRLVGLMLARRGWQVITAPNGVAALELARREPPDLILLDLMMPGMSGYEVCEDIRADWGLKDVPIIILTAMGPGLHARALRIGADAVLSKPVSPQALNETLNAFLLRRVSNV
jgi:two-component system cell cycle response regulator